MQSKFHSGVSNNNNPKNSACQQQAIVMNPLTDKEGLDKAYALLDKVYVHGDTMYVAGTSYQYRSLKQHRLRDMQTQMLCSLGILRLQIQLGILFEVVSV